MRVSPLSVGRGPRIGSVMIFSGQRMGIAHSIASRRGLCSAKNQYDDHFATLISRGYLLQSILMMESTQNGPGHHSVITRDEMARRPHDWHAGRGIRYAWPQAGVRPTLIVVSDQLLEDTPQMFLGQWDQEIEAFPPNSAN